MCGDGDGIQWLLWIMLEHPEFFAKLAGHAKAMPILYPLLSGRLDAKGSNQDGFEDCASHK